MALNGCIATIYLPLLSIKMPKWPNKIHNHFKTLLQFTSSPRNHKSLNEFLLQQKSPIKRSFPKFENVEHAFLPEKSSSWETKDQTRRKSMSVTRIVCCTGKYLSANADAVHEIMAYIKPWNFSICEWYGTRVDAKRPIVI